MASSRLRRGDDVVLVILGRIADRFADQGEGGEVHHRVDPPRPQRFDEQRSVEQFALDQPAGRTGAAVALRQVVVDPDFVAGRDQQSGGMAADVAGPAGDQNSHARNPCAFLVDRGRGQCRFMTRRNAASALSRRACHEREA